jgi:hypothetical protein
MLSSPVVVFTHIRSSHSFTQTTFNQFALMFLTSSIANFLTIQAFETKNKYLFFSIEISNIAAISSPFCKFNRFTIGCHFAVLDVSGIS